MSLKCSTQSSDDVHRPHRDSSEWLETVSQNAQLLGAAFSFLRASLCFFRTSCGTKNNSTLHFFRHKILFSDGNMKPRKFSSSNTETLILESQESYCWVTWSLSVMKNKVFTAAVHVHRDSLTVAIRDTSPIVNTNFNQPITSQQLTSFGHG